MIKNKLIFILYITLSIFSLHTPVTLAELQAKKDLDRILNEMEKVNAGFKTLSAKITYTRTITLLESTESSQGEMSYKKPKKLYLKFYPPRNEINIVDGKYVLVYHPADKQVEKYEMAKSKQSSQSVDFFEFGYGESVEAAKKEYKITLLDSKEDGKRRFYILDLIPKDTKAQYSDIRLWVEEGFWLPSKIELYESDGEVLNTIEMHSITLNKSISDKLFTFDIPRGVEVIEPFK